MRLCKAATILTGAVAALCLTFICVLLFSNFDRGVGLTDEALYISLARYPSAQNFSVSGFGYFTGLLLKAAGGSLFLFRTYGLLVLLAITLYFSVSVELYVRGTFALWDALPRILAILCFGLTYYFAWMVTPSYNWLTLISLLGMSASALFAVNRTSLLATIVLLLLIGGLGAVAFLAKPPSGAIAAVAYLFIVFSTSLRQRLWSALLIPALGAAVVVGVFVGLAGGPHVVVESAVRGLDMVATLGGAHLVGFDGYFQIDRRLIGIFGTLALLHLMVWTGQKYGVAVSWRLISFIGVSLFVASSAIFASLGLFSAGEQNYRAFTFPVLLLAASAWIAATASISLTSETSEGFVYPRLKRFAVFGVLIMLSYAAGSAVELGKNMAGVLVIAATILVHSARLCDRHAAGFFAGPANGALSLIAYYMLYSASLDPFVMTEPLAKQTEPIMLQGHYHLVDPNSARMVTELQSNAERAGWKPSMPLINLTGNSPITNVFLDARFVSSAWLLGGYSGSAEYARKALSFADETELQTAWLLTTPTGERPIDPRVLESFGKKFPDDYEKVVTVTMAFKAVPAQRITAWTEDQILWRPRK